MQALKDRGKTVQNAAQESSLQSTITGYFAENAPTRSGKQGENKISILPQVLLDFLLIAIPIIFLKLEQKKTAQELGLYTKGIKQDAKKTLVLFALLALAGIAVTALFSLTGFDDTQKVYSKISETKNTAPLVFAYLLVARVVSEEIFFRGFLAKKTGIFVSSAAFALAHAAYGSIAEVIGVFALGLVLANEFQKNKNLLPNILAHFLYNILVIVLLM